MVDRILSFILSVLVGTFPVTIPYTGFRYMEMSAQTGNKLVFRCDLVVNSSTSLTGYRFARGAGKDRHRWYLTILGRIGDHDHPPEMEFPSWRGLKLTIPRDSFDPKRDSVYYRDRDGRYQIPLGTRESWAKYLKVTREEESSDI